MRQHLIGRPRLAMYLLMAAALVAGAVIAARSPTLRRAVAALAATHVGLALAAAGVAGAAVLAHRRGRRKERREPGATLHSPRYYDWLAAIYCLGREGRMRERTLEGAGVAPGEHVLDVCCGTGTLAIAAKGRVGASGSVHGIDASEEMIGRARAKSSRRGRPVTFQVATAQSLPFPDATFDVVLCSLALHHLTDDARAAAIAEMRRVVKAGGRVMIVEFGERRGLRAVLHPVAL